MHIDTFIPETFTAIRAAAGPWLAPSRLPAGPYELVRALRAAEAQHGGEVRDLWGHAAATADAAAWIDADTDTARELWAVVRDYCERATAATADQDAVPWP